MINDYMYYNYFILHYIFRMEMILNEQIKIKQRSLNDHNRDEISGNK